jgi:hypothetical protein
MRDLVSNGGPVLGMAGGLPIGAYDPELSLQMVAMLPLITIQQVMYGLDRACIGVYTHS